MNLSYLKYAVEVEKTGSITKAAQNYYMNQPHLSKIIRELERDLGCPIFDRTSRGMIPTVRGEEFLRYAKGIMEQEAQLDKLCSRNKECPREIRLCGPRASYISSTLKNFLKEDDRLFTTNVRYKETNSKDVVRLVSSKEFDLGIVRCQVLYEPFFLKMIQDEHLDSKVLWQFSPKVLMSPSHPLAGKEPLDHLDFSQSVELLQGDIQYNVTARPFEEQRIRPDILLPRKILTVSFRTVIPAIPFIFMTGAASMNFSAIFQVPICGLLLFRTAPLQKQN